MSRDSFDRISLKRILMTLNDVCFVNGKALEIDRDMNNGITRT